MLACDLKLLVAPYHSTTLSASRSLQLRVGGAGVRGCIAIEIFKIAL
jgi:hypothetical protein